MFSRTLYIYAYIPYSYSLIDFLQIYRFTHPITNLFCLGSVTNPIPRWWKINSFNPSNINTARLESLFSSHFHLNMSGLLWLHLIDDSHQHINSAELVMCFLHPVFSLLYVAHMRGVCVCVITNIYLKSTAAQRHPWPQVSWH